MSSHLIYFYLGLATCKFNLLTLQNKFVFGLSLRMNDVRQDLEVELAEREHFLEKKAAEREFEEKKSELKENLLMEFEEKKRVIEQERYSLDLNGDSLEVSSWLQIDFFYTL